MKAVNAGPIVMELDGDFRHRGASEAALALLGLPVEALLGRTSTEAGLPSEVVEPLERELAAAVEGGSERHLELEMPTIDGVRWLHLRLVPEPGPEGDPGEEGGLARVKILASDITARKHAELRLSGENAAFRALVEDSADLIARIDADLRVTFVNRETERVTGRTAGAFLGRHVGALGLGVEMAGRWEEAVHAVFASGEPRSLDFRLVAPEGPRWYSARLLPEPGPERRVGYVIVSCTDVTDRIEREAEQAALRRVATVVAREGDLEEIARVAAQETALLLDATGSAVYRFESGEEATCVAAHPPAGPGAVISPVVALTGATATGETARTGMPGRVDDYRDGPSDPSTEEVLEAGLRSGIAAPLWARGRLWGALTAGSELPSAFGAGDERRLQAFAELTAIAVANAETRAELAHLADTDPLTGLANRRAFRERLDGEVMRAQRHGHLLTLAIIDIDDFKGINDTYGHLGGDAVLAEIGRRLAATRRAGELVARIGGEEFAWILPEVGAQGGLVAAERARRAIAAISVEGIEGVTCSVGICDLTTATNVDELLRLADRALYRAKDEGRDRVVSAVP